RERLELDQPVLEALRAAVTNVSSLQMRDRVIASFVKLGIPRETLVSNSGDPSDLIISSISSGVISLRIIVRAFEAQTQAQLVTTAIALKRYQLRHRKLPPDLSALVPEFLPALPRDPMNGQPLH